MDLTGLRWTKNVKHQGDDKYWAYDNINSENGFFLHWKTEYKPNACKPNEGELIILRQRAKVTHIVKLLNNTLYDYRSGAEFDMGRLVRVVWMTKDWDNSPENKEVFGCSIEFPRFGKVIALENIREFKDHWDSNGGILGFQKSEDVQEVLNRKGKWQLLPLELNRCE
jgi:hypothetical protein